MRRYQRSNSPILIIPVQRYTRLIKKLIYDYMYSGNFLFTGILSNFVILKNLKELTTEKFVYGTKTPLDRYIPVNQKYVRTGLGFS